MAACHGHGFWTLLSWFIFVSTVEVKGLVGALVQLKPPQNKDVEKDTNSKRKVYI